MKDEYRTATSADYAYIVRLLTNGDQEVLVRSVNTVKEPYPLANITKGPFGTTTEGITGYSLEGEPCTLRITNTKLGYVEIRRGNGSWYAPEMDGIILRVPK